MNNIANVNEKVNPSKKATIASRTTMMQSKAMKNKVERKLEQELEGKTINILSYLNSLNSTLKQLKKDIERKPNNNYAAAQRKEKVEVTIFYVVEYLNHKFKQKQEKIGNEVTNTVANKLYQLMVEFDKLKQEMSSIIQKQETEAKKDLTQTVEMLITTSYNIKMCNV